MDTRMIFGILALPLLAYIGYYVGLELWCYVYGLLY
tara:strand:- start:451 stop:558 length:108 start_codon:yes stop_codon:yes gene_type:complete